MKKIFNISLLFLIAFANTYGQIQPTNCITTQVESEIFTTTIIPPIPPPPPSGDRDGDGLPDNEEAEGDCDGDGIDNIDDPDSDNDGISDGIDDCPCIRNTPSGGCPRKLIPFVHGFQGSRNSWAPVVSWVDSEFGAKANARAIIHGDISTSLDDASNAIAQEISDYVISRQGNSPNDREIIKRNFIVGHSMGGMAMRNIEPHFAAEFDPSIGIPYDGIITLGTGHAGVFAADLQIYNKKKYEDAIGEACVLGHGKFKEAISNITKGIAVSIGQLDIDELCPALQGTILKGAELFFANNITQDLTTTAAQSWGTPTTKHNINIVSTETDDVQIVFTQKDENGVVLTTGNKVVHNTMTPRFFGNYFEPAVEMGLWGGDRTDDVGIKNFANMYTDLQTGYDEAEEKRKFHLRWAIMNTRFGNFPGVVYHKTQSNTARNVRDAYGDGLEFAPKIDPLWKELIGASGYTATLTHCNCIEIDETDPQGGYSYDFPLPTSGECSTYNEITDYGSINCHNKYRIDNFLNKPSDGFVLLESQMAAPYDTDLIIMEGSSHFQERNDSNLERELKAIFIDGSKGRFFKLKD